MLGVEQLDTGMMYTVCFKAGEDAFERREAREDEAYPARNAGDLEGALGRWDESWIRGSLESSRKMRFCFGMQGIRKKIAGWEREQRR